MDEIIALLTQTFNVQGPNANEQIQQAEQSLNEYGGSQEFCLCLFQIISTPDLNTSIKKSAIIYLIQMIYRYWDRIPQESKQQILINIPTILLNNGNNDYKLLMKLTSVIVEKTFPEQFNGWFEIIMNGIKSNEEKKIIMGLMIEKAIASKFKIIDDSNYHFYNDLCLSTLQVLTELVVKNDKLIVKYFCFKILRLLSIKSIPTGLNENILKHWFSVILNLENVVNLSNFEIYVKAAISFCVTYFYLYSHIIDPILSVDVMNAIVSISLMNINQSIQGKCVLFLKYALYYPPTCESIISDIDNFVQIVLYPYFKLTEEDIYNAINDPVQFVLDFHSFSYDESDPRSYLYESLKLHSKLLPELKNSLIRLLLSALESNNPAIIFSYCYLFSAVGSQVTNPEIISKIGSYLSNESFIVKCGCLLALRYLKLPIDYIYQTFLLLGDSSILVQYYSAINLSEYLPKLDKETANQIKEMCSGNIIDILQNYFSLAQEFNDYNFMELIQIYITFFGNELINYAVDFIMNTYQIFIKCISANNIISGNIIISSISLFIKMLPYNTETSNKVNDILFNQILEDITKIPVQAIESLIELAASIISLSGEISKKHWEIFNIFHSIQTQFPQAVCIAYKNLLIRDKETARIPEVAKMIIQIGIEFLSSIDSSNIIPILSFFSTIFIVLKGVENIEELFQPLLHIVLEAFNLPYTMYYASNIFASMILCNSTYLFQMLGQDKNSILNLWIEHCHFNELMATIINCYSSFNPDELVTLIVKSINLLNKEIKQYLINQICEDERKSSISGNVQEINSLQLFTENQLITDLFSLINKFDNENNGFKALIQNNFDENLQDIYQRALSIYK